MTTTLTNGFLFCFVRLTVSQVKSFAPLPHLPSHVKNKTAPKKTAKKNKIQTQIRDISTRKQYVDPVPKFDSVDTIAYWTDVEGSLNYVRRLVQRSKVAFWDDDNETVLDLKPGCGLVYGGDCFDKGPGDVRIGTMLVDLKRRYPDRVVLIIGNRDVNKMRFGAELHAEDLARPAAEWIKPAFHSNSLSLLDYWAWKGWVADECDHVHRLKYLLEHTMNSPNAFEFRRQELEILHGYKASDQEVFENFQSSILDGGIYLRYMQHAQLAALIGDTLFVHGAITEKSMGFVPDAKKTLFEHHDVTGRETTDSHSVAEWVQEMEDFVGAQLVEFQTDARWDGQRRRRGGEALMTYGHNSFMQRRSTMVSSFLKDGNLAHLSPSVANYLKASGVRRVVVGHQPFGDSPGIIRTTPGLEIICADTSFSDQTSSDNRGVAHSEVIIAGSSSKREAHIHGTLANGVEIAFDVNDADAKIGTQLDDETWVKARTVDGDRIGVHAVGFNISYTTLPPA
eukprot:m.183805 g.183805  ORF g.183805 m.183805 type:complete len:509 (-) comp32168_c4_seq2:40-1566(-)